MALQDYSEDPDQNGLVLGIDIAENCPSANLNNGIRRVMADIATWIKGAVFTGITQVRDVAGDTGNAILRFYNNTGTTLRGYISGLAGGGLALGNGTGEALRVTPDGRVGIGTTSPDYPLDINGDGRVSTLRFRNNLNSSLFSDGGNLRLTGDVGDYYNFDRANNLHEFFTGGSRRGYVDSAGRIVAATEIVASTIVRAGGFTNFYLSYNSGSPVINFDSGDYFFFDGTSNTFAWAVGTATRATLGPTGIFNAIGGVQSNGVPALTTATPHILSSSLGSTGYRRWSDGMWEMWGFANAGPNGTTRVNYPAGVSLNSWSNAVVSSGSVNPSEEQNNPFAYNPDTTGFNIYSSLDGSVGVWWQAKGV